MGCSILDRVFLCYVNVIVVRYILWFCAIFFAFLYSMSVATSGIISESVSHWCTLTTSFSGGSNHN